MGNIILVSRFGRMGGTRTFFKSTISHYSDKEGQIVLFLNKEQFDLDIENLVKNKKNIHVKFLPKIFPKNALNIFINNLYILFYCIFKNRGKVIYTDWNIYLDLISLLIPQKTIYFIHTTPTKKFPEIFRGLLYLFLRNKRLITVSKYTKNKIILLWVGSFLKSKVEYLYNYSSIQLVDKVKHNNLYILTLGHVRDYKNPKLWLEIAIFITNKYKNVEFIWAGDGELLNQYQAKVKKNNRIHFLGYIKDIEKLYRKTDIYMQLSLIESHGISVVDAMKYSIPCIVSNQGGLPENIHNELDGYVVDINNKTDVIKKIEALINDKNLREQMGINAYETYEKKFSRKVWEEKLGNIFSS
jgi:glycosyltransferase involved in cell wall biosynthesis